MHLYTSPCVPLPLLHTHTLHTNISYRQLRLPGQFGVVMHQSNGVKPESIQGDAVHFIVEVEDDPFKCGRHPVELWQRTQDGTLSDFDFHPEESEMSKR